MKRVLLVIGLGLVLLASVVLIRTVRLTSVQVPVEPTMASIVAGEGFPAGFFLGAPGPKLSKWIRSSRQPSRWSSPPTGR